MSCCELIDGPSGISIFICMFTRVYNGNVSNKIAIFFFLLFIFLRMRQDFQKRTCPVESHALPKVLSVELRRWPPSVKKWQPNSIYYVHVYMSLLLNILLEKTNEKKI